MSLNDVAAVILLKKKQFEDLLTAKEAIKETFKKEFPYWSFSDWDAPVSLPVGNVLFRIYEDSKAVSIRELIVDLPPLAESFKKSNLS